MNQNSNIRGFTLLELLVVIAIIGIMTSIAMMALSQSKNKGGDGGVKQNLVNARAQAAFYYNGSATSSDSYTGGVSGNMCNDARNGVYRQVQAAARAAGLTPQGTYANNTTGTASLEVCHAIATQFAIWVPLKQGNGWCIDSAGASRNTAPLDQAGNQYVCP